MLGTCLIHAFLYHAQDGLGRGRGTGRGRDGGRGGGNWGHSRADPSPNSSFDTSTWGTAPNLEASTSSFSPWSAGPSKPVKDRLNSDSTGTSVIGAWESGGDNAWGKNDGGWGDSGGGWGDDSTGGWGDLKGGGLGDDNNVSKSATGGGKPSTPILPTPQSERLAAWPKADKAVLPIAPALSRPAPQTKRTPLHVDTGSRLNTATTQAMDVDSQTPRTGVTDWSHIPSAISSHVRAASVAPTEQTNSSGTVHPARLQPKEPLTRAKAFEKAVRCCLFR